MFFKIIQKSLKKVRKISYFLKGIFEYNVQSSFKPLNPREMIINLTYRCNSKCIMCNIWQNDGAGEMSLEEWKKVMHDDLFNSIKILTLSGGEPVLTKNFEEKVKVIVEAMPQLQKLNIITNGFSQDLIIEKVQFLLDFCQQKEIELSVSVSLDGVGDIHEEIRRIPDAFEKTYGTIKRLQKLQQEYDFQIGSGAVLMKQTIDKAESFEEWAQERDLNLNFQIVGFHDTFVNNLGKEKELDFEEQQGMDQFLEFLKKKSKPKSFFDFTAYYWGDMYSFYKNGTNRTTPCPFLKDQFVLDCRGDVFYCLSEPAVGNVFKEDREVGEIYFDPKNLKIRRQRAKTACLHCNSGCNVNYALAKDFKKYGWYYLTGQLWKD